MQIIHIFLLFIISRFSDLCNRLSWLRVSFLANVRPRPITYTRLQLEVRQHLALVFFMWPLASSSAKTYSLEQICISLRYAGQICFCAWLTGKEATPTVKLFQFHFTCASRLMSDAADRRPCKGFISTTVLLASAIPEAIQHPIHNKSQTTTTEQKQTEI